MWFLLRHIFLGNTLSIRRFAAKELFPYICTPSFETEKLLLAAKKRSPIIVN